MLAPRPTPPRCTPRTPAQSCTLAPASATTTCTCATPRAALADHSRAARTPREAAAAGLPDAPQAAARSHVRHRRAHGVVQLALARVQPAASMGSIKHRGRRMGTSVRAESSSGVRERRCRRQPSRAAAQAGAHEQKASSAACTASRDTIARELLLLLLGSRRARPQLPLPVARHCRVTRLAERAERVRDAGADSCSRRTRRRGVHRFCRRKSRRKMPKSKRAKVGARPRRPSLTPRALSRPQPKMRRCRRRRRRRRARALQRR